MEKARSTTPESSASLHFLRHIENGAARADHGGGGFAADVGASTPEHSPRHELGELGGGTDGAMGFLASSVAAFEEARGSSLRGMVSTRHDDVSKQEEAGGEEKADGDGDGDANTFEATTTRGAAHGASDSVERAAAVTPPTPLSVTSEGERGSPIRAAARGEEEGSTLFEPALLNAEHHSLSLSVEAPATKDQEIEKERKEQQDGGSGQHPGGQSREHLVATFQPEEKEEEEEEEEEDGDDDDDDDDDEEEEEEEMGRGELSVMEKDDDGNDYGDAASAAGEEARSRDAAGRGSRGSTAAVIDIQDAMSPTASSEMACIESPHGLLSVPSPHRLLSDAVDWGDVSTKDMLGTAPCIASPSARVESGEGSSDNLGEGKRVDGGEEDDQEDVKSEHGVLRAEETSRGGELDAANVEGDGVTEERGADTVDSGSQYGGGGIAHGGKDSEGVLAVGGGDKKDAAQGQDEEVDDVEMGKEENREEGGEGEGEVHVEVGDVKMMMVGQEDGGEVAEKEKGEAAADSALADAIAHHLVIDASDEQSKEGVHAAAGDSEGGQGVVRGTAVVEEDSYNACKAKGDIQAAPRFVVEDPSPPIRAPVDNSGSESPGHKVQSRARLSGTDCSTENEDADAVAPHNVLSLGGGVQMLCFDSTGLPLCSLAHETGLLPRAKLGLIGAVYTSGATSGIELSSLDTKCACIRYSGMYAGRLIVVLILRSSSEFRNDQIKRLFASFEVAFKLIIGDAAMRANLDNIKIMRRLLHSASPLLKTLLGAGSTVAFKTGTVSVARIHPALAQDLLDVASTFTARVGASASAIIRGGRVLCASRDLWSLSPVWTNNLVLLAASMGPGRVSSDTFIESKEGDEVQSAMHVVGLGSSDAFVVYLAYPWEDVLSAQNAGAEAQELASSVQALIESGLCPDPILPAGGRNNLLRVVAVSPGATQHAVWELSSSDEEKGEVDRQGRAMIEGMDAITKGRKDRTYGRKQRFARVHVGPYTLDSVWSPEGKGRRAGKSQGKEGVEELYMLYRSKGVCGSLAPGKLSSPCGAGDSCPDHGDASTEWKVMSPQFRGWAPLVFSPA